MSALLALMFAVPLGAGALGLLARGQRRVQQVLSCTTIAGLLVGAVLLVAATTDGVTLATRIGGWPDGLAIVLAADGFAALLLVVTSAMSLVSLAFAIVRGEDDHPLFHPFVLVLLAGVFLALLTADLFNLFVAFEVMLIASYVLLTLKGGRQPLRAGVIYIAVNLAASTIFLLGVALLYGVAGTVDVAELHDIVPTDGRAAVGAGMVVIAVAIKAGIVPMHAWLPRAYVHAGPAVTALFSGLLTKVGISTLHRLYSVVFGGEAAWRPLLLVAAGLTMIIGVLGAVGRSDMRGILAFHMISQIGYLVLPLGLWTAAAVTAGTFYLLQYIAVKGSLFLAAGAVETLTGTGRLEELGGLATRRPLLATGFMLSALALAGIPPTSGFVGKYLLVLASFDAGQWIAGGVAVLVSLFTLLSMIKIWNGVFWGEATVAVRHERRFAAAGRVVPSGAATDGAEAFPTTGRWRVTALVAPCLVIGIATVVLGLGANWLLEIIGPAARGLIDPTAYLEAVNGA